MEAEIGSGKILSPTAAIDLPVYFPFYCRDGRALPGVAAFFLTECYQRILMNTESTNGLNVTRNQRTPRFFSQVALKNRQKKERKERKEGSKIQYRRLCFGSFIQIIPRATLHNGTLS